MKCQCGLAVLMLACVVSPTARSAEPVASRAWINGVALDRQGLLQLEAPVRSPTRIPGLPGSVRAEREIVIHDAQASATHQILRYPKPPTLVRAQLDHSLAMAGWVPMGLPDRRDWRAAWFVRGKDLLGIHLVGAGRETRVIAGFLEAPR